MAVRRADQGLVIVMRVVAVALLPLRDLERLPAYQRTETADSDVTFPTVASYRNDDLCKTDAKPAQNGEKPAQNGADPGQDRVDLWRNMCGLSLH